MQSDSPFSAQPNHIKPSEGLCSVIAEDDEDEDRHDDDELLLRHELELLEDEIED
jgi:hypothetical protein